MSNPADEHFVYQAGREFFLLHGPWIRSGDDLFDTNIVMHYNAVERFENDDNVSEVALTPGQFYLYTLASYSLMTYL